MLCVCYFIVFLVYVCMCMYVYMYVGVLIAVVTLTAMSIGLMEATNGDAIYVKLPILSHHGTATIVYLLIVCGTTIDCFFFRYEI